jgi:hypothetical protein
MMVLATGRSPPRAPAAPVVRRGLPHVTNAPFTPYQPYFGTFATSHVANAPRPLPSQQFGTFACRAPASQARRACRPRIAPARHPAPGPGPRPGSGPRGGHNAGPPVVRASHRGKRDRISGWVNAERVHLWRPGHSALGPPRRRITGPRPRPGPVGLRPRPGPVGLRPRPGPVGLRPRPRPIASQQLVNAGLLLDHLLGRPGLINDLLLRRDAGQDILGRRALDLRQLRRCRNLGLCLQLLVGFLLGRHSKLRLLLTASPLPPAYGAKHRGSVGFRRI